MYVAAILQDSLAYVASRKYDYLLGSVLLFVGINFLLMSGGRDVGLFRRANTATYLRSE